MLAQYIDLRRATVSLGITALAKHTRLRHRAAHHAEGRTRCAIPGMDLVKGLLLENALT